MDFWFAFKNNLIIVLLCIIGQIGIAFIISALLNSKMIRFKEFHRTVIFFPIVMSAVVLGIMWGLIYNKDIGVLNWFLSTIGLESLIKPWLDDPKIVIFSVVVPLIWQYIGFYMVILMSGMQSIPAEVYEVADIDGATGIQKALYITLPLLKNTIKVTIMLCIAGNMIVFDHIYVMTGGGPGKSSMVLAQYAYNNSFVMFKMGYGSAISMGIMILSMGLVLLTRLLLRGDTVEE
jgi:raffinose/stachyose/melibiose transport system permease protein